MLIKLLLNYIKIFINLGNFSNIRSIKGKNYTLILLFAIEKWNGSLKSWDTSLCYNSSITDRDCVISVTKNKF